MAKVFCNVWRRSLSSAIRNPPQCITRTPVIACQRRNLPICTVDTNIKKTDVPKDFNANLSKLIANMLNKPERLISVVLRTEVEICRDGNDSPSAFVHIWSIGVFDEKRNPGYSKQLFEFIPQALNMPEDRIAIMMHPIEKKDAGHLLYAEMKANK